MDKNSLKQNSTNQFNEHLVCHPGPDGSCAVCADEGVPGRVVALLPNNMAQVALPAGEQEVALDLLDGTVVGDTILVHVGVAIANLTAVEEEDR